VPLIFVDTKTNRASTKWASGNACQQPVSLLDVYPTLVDICGLTKPDRLDGQSLVPLLRNPEQQTDRAVVTTQGYLNHAIRSENWRYIRYADGTEELYDHRKDPHEFTNLAQVAKHSAVKDKLAKWLPDINRKPRK
jgi:arylsulfatase A-like enzyme